MAVVVAIFPQVEAFSILTQVAISSVVKDTKKLANARLFGGARHLCPVHTCLNSIAAPVNAQPLTQVG